MSDHKEHCSRCGAVMVEARFSQTTSHEFRVAEAQGLERFECGSCGAQHISARQARQNQLKLTDAERKAVGLLTSDEIKRVREKLKLTQQEAGELIGGGPMAFSKYERGVIAQSVAMNSALRILNAFPQALGVLRGDDEWESLGAIQIRRRVSHPRIEAVENDQWYEVGEAA